MSGCLSFTIQRDTYLTLFAFQTDKQSFLLVIFSSSPLESLNTIPTMGKRSLPGHVPLQAWEYSQDLNPQLLAR